MDMALQYRVNSTVLLFLCLGQYKWY